MVELQHLQSHQTHAILAALADDGACVVENALSTALCDALLDDFAPHLAAMDWGLDELGYRDDFYGARTKRLHGLFSKSSHMVDVLLQPLLIQLAQDLFVTTKLAKDIRLSNAELMVLGQKQGVQDFHTDAVSWAYAQRHTGQEILVSANYALTEFTTKNGATRVVPGSHCWDSDRRPREQEICLATMPKGAALIYSGNVLHSGGKNDTAEQRTGLYVGLIPSWLKPIENQLITNESADILACPETARRLLDVVPGGFDVYA